MELKHFLSDINDLRIYESNNDLSEWGKNKLNEYEFILTELNELKKLRVGDVSGRSELFTCKHCGTHEKQWSRKNDDWYCKTCGHICR